MVERARKSEIERAMVMGGEREQEKVGEEEIEREGRGRKREGCVETFCSALCRQAESWKVAGEGFQKEILKYFQKYYQNLVTKD